METAPTVRQADVPDARALLQYLERFLADGDDTVLSWSTLPSLAGEEVFLEKHSGDCGAVFIVEDGGEVVAMIDFLRMPRVEFRHSCQFGISVLKAHRRRGYARALLRAAEAWCRDHEAWCRDHGVTRLELNVMSHNEGAIRLYESLGFKEEGRRVGGIRLLDGRVLDDIVMAKILV